MEKQKTLKEYCKDAKKRLKSGFWQNYHDNLETELIRAKSNGISESKIKEYYSDSVSRNVKDYSDEDEAFYQKVKRLLDEEGEVSDAIGRLTDKSAFDSLSYDDKQRYTLNLSERYIHAVERYYKERSVILKA